MPDSLRRCVRLGGRAGAALLISIAAGAPLGLAPGVLAQGEGVRRDAMPQADDDAPMRLRSGLVDMADPARSAPDLVRAFRAGEQATARALLRLDGPMTRERRAALQGAGVTLTGYAGDGVHSANLRGANPRALEAIDFIAWSAPVRPEWKIDPSIGRETAFVTPGRRALADAGRLSLLVTTYDDADALATADAVRAVAGVRIVETAPTLGILNITATRAALDAIAALDAVAYIEEAPEATLRNSTVRWIVQTNVNGLTPLYTHALTGLGQIIGLQDGYPKEPHCSFDDSVAPGPSHRKFVSYGPDFPPSSWNNHGTHVAGTLAGDPGSESDLRGHAYEARIAYRLYPTSLADVTNGTEFATSLQINHDAGARVHSNSWGDDGTSTKEQYKGWSRVSDKFSHDNEEDLVIFAITNFSTAFNSPENAKNIIAVSAVGDTPNQNNWAHGGIGPTRELEHLVDDITRDPLPGFPEHLSTNTYGRLKPDILAPGAGITSASNNINNCGAVNNSGTSMATPAVAGIAALTRQYFMDGFYPSGIADASDAFTPTGALLRAVMINSGQNVTGAGPGGDSSYSGYPTNREGWGRLTIDRSLHFSGEARTLEVVDVRHADVSALDTGLMNEHVLHVRNAAEQLRITMAFTDPEPDPAALDVVVNDLDLEVVSPSGVVYKGNVFDTVAGVSVSGGDFDPRNNLEQVHVSAPELGPWKVRVHGAAVNEPSQGYAIAATGGIEVTCIADINNDNTVDGADLAWLLAQWLGSGVADLNGDGATDGADLATMLAAWGACP